MVKRKASQLETAPDATGLRRSTRRKPAAPDLATDATENKSTEKSATQLPKTDQKKISKKLPNSKASPVRICVFSFSSIKSSLHFK